MLSFWVGRLNRHMATDADGLRQEVKPHPIKLVGERCPGGGHMSKWT